MSRDPSNPFVRGSSLEGFYKGTQQLDLDVNAESQAFSPTRAKIQIGMAARTGITGLLPRGESERLYKLMQAEAAKLAPSYAAEYGENAHDMAMNQVLSSDLGKQYTQVRSWEIGERESGLGLSTLSDSLSRTLGGKLSGMTFQTKVLDTEKQLEQLTQYQGAGNPLLAQAKKQLALLNKLAPAMDATNDLADEAKLGAVGEVGFKKFDAQSQGLETAMRYARENIKDQTVIKRLLGEQIAQREEQIRQYERAGKQAVLKLITEQSSLQTMKEQASIVRSLANGSLADVQQARIQRSADRNTANAGYQNTLLEITSEKEDNKYSRGALVEMAAQLGIQNPEALSYDSLNVQVAGARRNAALTQLRAGQSVADKNFASAQSQRLAGLLAQPLGQYETLASRVSAAQESSKDAAPEDRALLPRQLGSLSQVDAAGVDTVAFDRSLKVVRDQYGNGETLPAQTIRKLFTQTAQLPQSIQALVLPTLTPLLERTSEAAKLRTLKADTLGLSVADEQSVTSAELKVLSLRYGGAQGDELLKAARKDLTAAASPDALAAAGRVVELFKQQTRLTAQLDEMKKVAQPIENAGREIQDAERDEGKVQALSIRQRAQTELSTTFTALGLGQTPAQVLSMTQEELNTKYGLQAAAVKKLAEFLRQLGIEIQQSTENIDAENRARDVQQAQLGVSRASERGASAAALQQQFSLSESGISKTLSGVAHRSGRAGAGPGAFAPG